jgi:hypothetical protein
MSDQRKIYMNAKYMSFEPLVKAASLMFASIWKNISREELFHSSNLPFGCLRELVRTLPRGLAYVEVIAMFMQWGRDLKWNDEAVDPVALHALVEGKLA